MFTALMNVAILAGVVAGACLLSYQCYQTGKFLFARGRVRRFLAWLANDPSQVVQHFGK